MAQILVYVYDVCWHKQNLKLTYRVITFTKICSEFVTVRQSVSQTVVQ